MGKKLGVLLLALVLCLGVFAPMSAMAGTPTTYVTLPSGMTALNVRAEPSTSSAVVTWVYNGSMIDLISVGSEWTKIRTITNQNTGYIKNKYILELPDGSKDPDEPSTPATPSKTGTAQAALTTAGVNVRKGPGSGYAKVTSVSAGTKLKIWGNSGNWYYVTTSTGKDGWISKTYCKLTYTAKTTARVNFREAVNGKLIKTLPVGTSCTVYATNGDWSKVKVGSTTGWLYSRYLK